jgi:hypothetical protein
MISRKFAEDQIRRLASLPGYPTLDAGFQVLVDMLETAPSPGAARTFVTCWLQDEPVAPQPTHVYRYFHPIKTGDAEHASSTPASSKNCPHCNGVGWVVVNGPNQTTAAKACRCRQLSVATSME